MAVVERELRAAVSAPVKVMWTDAYDVKHSEIAHTINISAHGMRIRHQGLLCKPGEVVTISCGTSSLRFCVLRIKPAGKAAEGEAALKVETPGKDISQLALQIARVQTGLDGPVGPGAVHMEQRAMPRYPCEGSVQVWRQGQTSPIDGKLRDLGLSGCFVGTTQPFPVGTEVRLSLSVFGMTVRAQGIVRHSVAGEGIGIQFTALQSQDIIPLNTVLKELAPR